MTGRNFYSLSLSLSLGNASILQRIKDGYLIWVKIVPHIPRSARFTVGARIENKLLDLLELTYIAYFTAKEGKQEKIYKCILTLDTLKFLIYIIWEVKFISHKQYKEIAIKLNEIGKMLNGWKKDLNKKLPPDK